MLNFLALILAHLALAHTNHAVKDLTEILMAEITFTEDAINQVLVLSEGVRASRLIEPRRSYLECIDRLDSRSCVYLVQLGACNTKPRSMKEHCQKSCGFCVDPPCNLSKYGCCLDGKTLAQGPHMQGCHDDCKDALGKVLCHALKKNGQCLKPGLSIRRRCAVTCGYCRPCIDEEPYHCLLASRYGRCSLNHGGFLDVCRRTCKICGRNDPCHDFPCPPNSVCHIGGKGAPYCKCDGNCKPGDSFTGVVCGRDGNEYKSLCDLKQRNCGKPNTAAITVKNYGNCDRGVAFSDKRRLCQKKRPQSDLCKKWTAAGFCQTRRKEMKQICPQACSFCGARYPLAACNYMKNGCCLDNKTPCLDTNYKGCPKFPACKDFAKTFCRRFVAVCGTKSHRATMNIFCPKTCHLCT